MANEKAGKHLLLQVKKADTNWGVLGGLRSKSMSISAEGIDVTNHESDEWKTLLDQAGIRSVALSGSGVHNGDADTIGLVKDNMLTQTLTEFRIIDFTGDINSPTVIESYTGFFKITSFELSSEYNADQQYSISLESSGEIVKA